MKFSLSFFLAASHAAVSLVFAVPSPQATTSLKVSTSIAKIGQYCGVFEVSEVGSLDQKFTHKIPTGIKPVNEDNERFFKVNCGTNLKCSSKTGSGKCIKK
jgi:hypothetical protein